MTGPEHHRIAEQLMLDINPDKWAPEYNMYRATHAQVHAVLAVLAELSELREVIRAGLPPGGTPATDPAHIPGSAVPQLLRELEQEPGRLRPDPPGK